MNADNRLVNVFCVRNILAELFKRGTRAVSIEANAVPEDAQLRGGGYDVQTNRFYLTFEHPSFKALENGELIPELRPLFRDVSPLTNDWSILQFTIDPEHSHRIRFGHTGDALDFFSLPAPILAYQTGPLGVMFQCADGGIYLLSSETGNPNDKGAWYVKLLHYV